MIVTEWRNKFFLISIYLLAFVISFPYIFGAVAIWIFAAAWVIQGNLKSKMRELLRPGYLIWIVFFLLHAISFLYSSDKQESLANLESKLSFLIFPVIIGTGLKVDKIQLEKIFVSFILGLSVTAVICIANALWLYSSLKDPEVFFYHSLVSRFESNAVYMSFYVTLALVVLILFKSESRFGKRFLGPRAILFTLLFVFFLLLSCRLLLVVFFVFVCFYSLFQIKKGHVSTTKKIGIISVILLAASFVLLTDNPIKKRYLDLNKGDIEIAFEKDYHNRSLLLNNLNTRPFIWRVCIQNIVENNLWWAGCGNGDLHHLQNKKMRDLGLPQMNENDNPRSNLYDIAIHNMYLHTLMMLGIPGLSCLLIIVFMPFFKFRKSNQKNIFIMFQITGALFMMQESVLETQAGIIYFTFFSILFWNYYYSQKKDKKTELHATL